MKKILSLLCLLMLAMTSAWAGEVATFNLGTKNGVSTPDGFFKSVGEKWNWNNKFTGGEYDGISFSNGLKMEGTTKIGFTTTAVSTVTIVQSTWSANTIKLDDVELAVADAVDGTGCRIYTVTDVAAGDHVIGRGSGESGLFYVKVEWEATKTVTFINDANWAKVFVWAWNDTENFTGGTWPGVELTANGEGNYTWSTTGAPTMILFNDGDSNQTSDEQFKAGGVYKSTGRVVVKNDYTATFKTDGMEEAWAYVFGDEESLGTWPGTKMTGSNGEFSITISAEEAPKFIIFHNNAGEQTDDLAFEDGKVYEYNLSDFSVTFTTDAGWDPVNVYAWGNKKEYAGTWPGTALTAENGIYTYSFKAFKAPESIQFNGGDDSKKTPDLGFTNGRAYKWIATLDPLFKLAASEEKIPAGTTVEVKDGDDVVATLTYGVSGGEDFAAPSLRPNEEYAGFQYYTAGNGVNGSADGGTVYTINPVYDGTITVGVWLNGDKSFYITEDGTALSGFDGYKQAYGSGTAFEFAVKAGSTYKVFCTGSKLGFYGFDYTYTKPAVVISSMSIVGDFIGGQPTAEEAEPWWNPANGWAMTQDATNPAIWTLTKEFTAEAKTYEYKAVANGKYGGYELPAQGNNNFVFGTNEYPAGDYALTFTADTENHTLTLTAEKVVPATTTATFDFADPSFRKNIGESMTDTKGYIYNETFTADGVTLQVTAGSAPSRIYVDANRGQNLVTYKEYTTLAFRAPQGKAITKIEFTPAGNSNINNFTASSGTIEGMTWTGNAEGVRFAQGGTSYLANAIVTLADVDKATAELAPITYTECDNIAAFNALDAGTYAKLTLKDAEITGKSADGYSTVFIQDATGGAWIQYTSLNDKLQEKTKISGTVYTVKRMTSGNPQFKEAEDTPASEFTAEAINNFTIVEGTLDAVNVAANLNKVVKLTGATLEMTSATAGKLTQGEFTIDVNNGSETANQQLHKIAEWTQDTKKENVTIVAILVAKSATANQLLPISIEETVDIFVDNPDEGDLAAVINTATEGKDVANMTIKLKKNGVYTLGSTITAPNNIFFYGEDATVTVDENVAAFITLDGTKIFAKKADDTQSDHYLIKNVEIRGVTIKGLKGVLVKDNQKTLVEELVIDYANIEMPAAAKNVLDFNGKGYVGKVTVTNSTIWANGMNTGFFAQYGSRPKNVNGDWLQEFVFENNTVVNIANGKNFCDLKQNGTAQNVYTLKNNIFVDCGKAGQTVVGFNKGQASASPVWAVEGNYFEAAGECKNAAEIEKAGKQNEENIVKNCVDGKVTFTDAANGDFNGEFALAEGATEPQARLGAPAWTITYKAAPAAYYLVGTMTNWVENGVKEENKLTLNDQAQGEEYMITIDLKTTDQFKIVKKDGDNYVYYPDGTGNAYGENGEITADGNYTVYFRPNADGGDDWFNKVIYMAKNTSVGINTVTVIPENAVIFNMKGQRVKNAKNGLYIVNGKKVMVK